MYLFVNAKDNKNKVYEVRIKLFYTIGYKPKNGLAERKGFEPSIPISQNTRFPSARLKPLGHPSILKLIQLPKISIAFLSVTSFT